MFLRRGAKGCCYVIFVRRAAVLVISSPYPGDGILSSEVHFHPWITTHFWCKFGMARDVEAKDDNPRPRKRRRQNESGNIGSQAKLKKEVLPI